MTNREWLESLSDDDLAEHLVPQGLAYCLHCKNVKKTCKKCERVMKKVKWLKAERSESK